MGDTAKSKRPMTRAELREAIDTARKKAKKTLKRHRKASGRDKKSTGKKAERAARKLDRLLDRI